MRNIKKMICILLIVVACKIYGMGGNPGIPPDDHCLVAFVCKGNFENALAYKTGCDAELCFGIVTQEQRGETQLLNCPQEDIYYFLRLLAKPKMVSYRPLNLVEQLSHGPSNIRKVTATEKELIRKAIRYNGARFWGFQTDGDSLELLESSK